MEKIEVIKKQKQTFLKCRNTVEKCTADNLKSLAISIDDEITYLEKRGFFDSIQDYPLPLEKHLKGNQLFNHNKIEDIKNFIVDEKRPPKDKKKKSKIAIDDILTFLNNRIDYIDKIQSELGGQTELVEGKKSGRGRTKRKPIGKIIVQQIKKAVEPEMGAAKKIILNKNNDLTSPHEAKKELLKIILIKCPQTNHFFEQPIIRELIDYVKENPNHFPYQLVVFLIRRKYETENEKETEEKNKIRCGESEIRTAWKK